MTQTETLRWMCFLSAALRKLWEQKVDAMQYLEQKRNALIGAILAAQAAEARKINGDTRRLCVFGSY